MCRLTLDRGPPASLAILRVSQPPISHPRQLIRHSNGRNDGNYWRQRGITSTAPSIMGQSYDSCVDSRLAIGRLHFDSTVRVFICRSPLLRLNTDNSSLQDVSSTGFCLLLPRFHMDFTRQPDFWILLHLEPAFCCNVGMRA